MDGNKESGTVQAPVAAQAPASSGIARDGGVPLDTGGLFMKKRKEPGPSGGVGVFQCSLNSACVRPGAFGVIKSIPEAQAAHRHAGCNGTVSVCTASERAKLSHLTHGQKLSSVALAAAAAADLARDHATPGVAFEAREFTVRAVVDADVTLAAADLDRLHRALTACGGSSAATAAAGTIGGAASWSGEGGKRRRETWSKTRGWPHGARVRVDPDLALMRKYVESDLVLHPDMQLTLTREVQLTPDGAPAGTPPEAWQEFALSIPNETEAVVSSHYAKYSKWLRIRLGKGQEERMIKL